MDIDVPDGAEEAVLRACRLGARVVICTAGVAPQRMKEVRRPRLDAFVLKPVGVDELARACGLSI